MNGLDRSLQSIIDPDLQAQWMAGTSKKALLAQLFATQVDNGVMPRAQINGISRLDSFHADGMQFCLQRNYGRVTRGVSDQVHPAPPYSIPFRGGMPCFCCPEVISYQWPNERGIYAEVGGKPLVILPNISPIFVPHFTVISPEHRPQLMDCNIAVALAAMVPGAWVIQNGQDAGATNPWHYHLQLFFADDLPLVHCPIENGGDAIGVLHHPTLIVRISAPDPALFEAQLSDFVAEYLNLGETRRVNLLIREGAGLWTGYVVLRDTRFRTDLYRSGQPGYAEPAGIISAVDDASYDIWASENVRRYHRLMTDIRPIDAETVDFIQALLAPS